MRQLTTSVVLPCDSNTDQYRNDNVLCECLLVPCVLLMPTFSRLDGWISFGNFTQPLAMFLLLILCFYGFHDNNFDICPGVDCTFASQAFGQINL